MKMTLLGALTLTAWVETAFSADTPPPEKTIGINPAYRNLSVKPGDDFEEYANGGWRKSAEIPADRASAGAGFEVFERAEKRNADLVREAVAANPSPDTPRGMIAAYYAAVMDTANIEKRGLDPLKEKLREIDAIKTKTDLARVLGERLRADVDPLNATVMWTENLFGLWVTQALSEPDRTVPYLLQGGLGMADREYYLSDKPEMAKLRTAYQSYVGEVLKLAGMSDPAGRAERIMALEKKMAAVHADLGDAAGKIYVAKYFPPSSKAAVEGLVNNLLTAFDRRIDGLSWMAPPTKAQAKAKLKTLRVGVGYPEIWRDYSGLVIRRDDPTGNAWRADEWEYLHQLAKIGRPVDRGEWWMTPQ